MTLKRSHMIGALGGALTMTAIMAVPAYADTLTDATTNEESILYTESWNDKAAANVESYANIRVSASADSGQTRHSSAGPCSKCGGTGRRLEQSKF